MNKQHTSKETHSADKRRRLPEGKWGVGEDEKDKVGQIYEDGRTLDFRW